MNRPPRLLTILLYLIVPAVIAVVVLAVAKRRGATWTQIEASFLAAMFAAFITAGGWLFGGYLAEQDPVPWKIIGSELLVSAICGIIAFFATMPSDQHVEQ